MIIPEAAFAADGDDPPADPETGEQTEEPASGELTVEDSYGALKLADAYDRRAIVLPESMQPVPSADDPEKMIDQVTFSKPKYGEGLLLTGKAGVLKSGRIGLNAALDFTGNPVGRVSVNGLRERGVTVTVHVYLDDQEDPVASFNLKSTMGKKDWANAGDRTKDVYGLGLTGQHRVSFSFEISGVKDTKKTSILLRFIEFSESSIPVLYFNIDESLGTIGAMNGSSDHSVECYGTVDLQVPEGFAGDYDGGAQTSLNGLEIEYLRGRGNSTWDTDKKPYKLKLKKKKDLFGMGENKHWILLANRYDNSLIRNRMTYWLGAQMGLDYTPQCVPVDVVMNGEYYGSYLLCEQIRIGDSRVAIDDLEADEDSMKATELPFISGGYLLSMSPYGDEDKANIFETKKGVSMFIESPSFEDFDNDTQRQYIIAFIQATENTIFSPGFRSGDVRYTDLLDLDAAAKYWWIQEFSANGDAYGSGSTFLYKTRDKEGEDGAPGESGKLFWGPLWDFDYVAWGDLDYSGDSPGGFENTSMPWFDRMKADPAFAEKQLAYWTGKDGEKQVPSLNALLTEIVKDGGLLDQYYEQTKTSWKYDHEKWGAYGEGWGDEYAGETDDTPAQAAETRTYKEEVDQLRNWIIGRQDNVNQEINSLKPEIVTVTFKVGNKTLDSIPVRKGSYIEEFPEAPAKKGYVFRGWKSKQYGIISEGDEIDDNMVLTAYYIKESQAIRAKNLFFQPYNIYRPLEGMYGEDDYYPDYSVMPYDSDETQIRWSSSDPSVATVNNEGTVSFKKTGKVKITGKVGSVSNSYMLHIYDPKTTEIRGADEISFNKKSLTLSVNEYAQIRAAFKPQPCDGGSLTWVSLDEDIATVDSIGVVTGISAGKTVIVAFDIDTGMYQTCKVTVASNTPAKLTAPKLKLTPNYGKNQIKASWSKAKGAKSYKVAYRKAGAKKWKTLKTKKTSVAVKKLKKGSIYMFRAQTVGKSKSSKWSKQKTLYFSEVNAKVKAGKKKVTVKWKKDKKANGYQIRYSYSSNMNKAKTINVKKSHKKYKIKKLKKGKKVYVQIRPYKKYKGKTYYGIYSKKKAVRVK